MRDREIGNSDREMGRGDMRERECAGEIEKERRRRYLRIVSS